MIRDVDLMEYLPEYLREYRELREVMLSEKPEFALLWFAADKALLNVFIATADETGIARYEALLGIAPMADDTLESRRARIQARWYSKLPYTKRALFAKLAGLFGGSNFSLRIADYTVHVTVYSRYSSQVEELKQALREMLPANMIFDIVYENALEGDIYFGARMSIADYSTIRQVG